MQVKFSASATVKWLAGKGLASGKYNFEQGQIGASWFYNKVVFSKVQALVGGRVRLMATGSAPLSPDIQCFIQTCFNCPVRQGYGCTETGGGSAIGHLLDNTVSQVGPPTACAARWLAQHPPPAGVYQPKAVVRRDCTTQWPPARPLSRRPAARPGWLRWRAQSRR